MIGLTESRERDDQRSETGILGSVWGTEMQPFRTKAAEFQGGTALAILFAGPTFWD